MPINFVAVKLAAGYVHPRVLGQTGSLPAQMQLTFIVALVAMTLLYITFWKYEMAHKHASRQIRGLRRRLLGVDALAPQPRSAAPR